MRYEGTTKGKPWDTMTEQELRHALKRVRAIANGMGQLAFMVRRVPELQAEEIVSGNLRLYTIASEMITGTILYYLPDKIPKTEEDIKRELRLEFSPVGLLDEIILPCIRHRLKSLECYMVERGYRLPKWHRPEWLEEMAGRG